MNIKSKSEWLIPISLLMLGILNIASGAFQLSMIAEGATPDNLSGDFSSPQYFKTPLPIVLHLLTGIVFNLLSPFQFATKIRQRFPVLHRWSGRLLFICGILAAATGLWMNQFFPVFGTGLKYIAVAIFSTGMIVSLVLALAAILRGKIQCHRVWMMRSIAIALAPAVQRLILLPMFLIFGDINILLIEFVVWLSFLFNLAFVQWILIRESSNDYPNQTVELHS